VSEIWWSLEPGEIEIDDERTITHDPFNGSARSKRGWQVRGPSLPSPDLGLRCLGKTGKHEPLPHVLPPKRPIALKSISKFSSIAQMNFQPDLKHSMSQLRSQVSD